MKNKTQQIIVALLFNIAMLSASCNKAVSPVIMQETKNADEHKRALMSYKGNFEEYTLAVMQQYSPAMQRAVFREMPATRKAALWQERIDLAISEETSAASRDALTRLKAMLTPSLYTDGPDAHPEIASWVATNMTLIGYERMKQIVTTFSSSNPDAAPNPPGGSKVDCECNTKSDWCMDDGWNSSHGLKCQPDNDCEQSRWGCGIVLAYPCMGMCKPR